MTSPVWVRKHIRQARGVKINAKSPVNTKQLRGDSRRGTNRITIRRRVPEPPTEYSTCRTPLGACALIAGLYRRMRDRYVVFD